MELNKEYMIRWLKLFIEDLEVSGCWKLVVDLNNTAVYGGFFDKFKTELFELEKNLGLDINNPHPRGSPKKLRSMKESALKLIKILELSGE